MIFTSLFIAHMLGRQSAAPVDVTIHHRRASQVLEILERSESVRSLNISADDSKGCLVVQGSPMDVKEVQDLAKLLDISRPKLSVKVRIDSDVDKESYEVSTKIYDQQKWTTGDGDTGVTLALEPRLNPDHTVTVLVNYFKKGSSGLNEVFRMKLGSTRVLALENEQKREIREGKGGKLDIKSFAVPQPRVTIRIDG